MNTDFFMRDGKPANRDGAPRCFRCGEAKPLMPIGLANLGFCRDCLMAPGSGWNFKRCPYCWAATDGEICEECRAEGTWRFLEVEIFRMRNGHFPKNQGDCLGRQRAMRNRAKASRPRYTEVNGRVPNNGQDL